MKSHVFAEHDRVGIFWQTAEREIIYTPEVARDLANQIEINVMLADVCQVRGRRDTIPTVDVEAILVGNEPRVMLKFGRPIKALYLPPKWGKQLAELIGRAADKAEQTSAVLVK